MLWLLLKFCRQSILNICTEFEYLLFNGIEEKPSGLISEVARGGLYSKESGCASYNWVRSETTS